MDTKIKKVQSRPAENNQTNSKARSAFPRERVGVEHEFAGAIIDFQISGKFLSVSRSKKVKEFIKAANTWSSGYSHGETIVVEVEMQGHDKTFSFLVKDTRRANVIAKSSEGALYGNLTLKIYMRADGRGQYSIIEKSKRGVPSYKEVLNAALNTKNESRHSRPEI